MAQAPLDVTEIVFESPGGYLELAPELLEAQLIPGETVDDPLPHRLGGGELRHVRRAAEAQYSASGGATRSSVIRISF